MAIIDMFFDKISRLTHNPNLWHLPKRCAQQMLRMLHFLRVYKIPTIPILREFDGDLVVNLIPDEFLTHRVWFLGYVHYNEEYFFRSFARGGMTVIDAGANVGHTSLICEKRVGRLGLYTASSH